MQHGLQELMSRLKNNQLNNISLASEELIDEVIEEINIYGSNTNVIIWCDPKDDFIKNYFVIDSGENDPEGQIAIACDKATFAKDKKSEDLYIATLPELLDALKYQDRVV